MLVRGYRSRLGRTLRAAEGLDKLGELARGAAARARHVQNARSGMIRDGVENTQLGQNEKEVLSLNFYKEQSLVFA